MGDYVRARFGGDETVRGEMRAGKEPAIETLVLDLELNAAVFSQSLSPSLSLRFCLANYASGRMCVCAADLSDCVFLVLGFFRIYPRFAI